MDTKQTDKKPSKVPVKEELPKIVQVKKLTILEVGVYQGYNYFLQRMSDVFQYIIFHNGEFFQAYISVQPEKGQEDFTQMQLIEVAKVIKNFMETTVEALIQKEKFRKEEAKKPKEKTN